MTTVNLLSGKELVSKGITRLDANLPETGIKDVVSNGSWLEQKQIQAAVESKKHLVEVERIQKIGSVSQAEWKEDINLAEVTHKVGGYWHFVGHNIGRTLYLKPEEALFLMECNCLLLKFGGVTVSFQQAYSLLLKGDITPLKYKVYAALSRIGYKVFRHKKIVSKEFNDNKIETIEENILKEEQSDSAVDKSPAVIELKESLNNQLNNEEQKTNGNNKECASSYNNVYKSYQYKIVKLKKRKLKQASFEESNLFNTLPNFIQKNTITLNVPDTKYIPENMHLNESYTINLRNLSNRNAESNRSYSFNDEANGSHIKRINMATSSRPTHFANKLPPGFLNHQFRPGDFRIIGPFPNFENINKLFRTPLSQLFFPSPFQTSGPQLVQRPVIPNNSPLNMNMSNRFPVYRNLTSKEIYLERIKYLSNKLKGLVATGNAHRDNEYSLHTLIKTYNSRYKTNLQLGPNFDIISGSRVETIELEDDDEPQRKRAKIEYPNFKTNLKALKETVAELKDLEDNGKATARHRRSFSKLLKTFNRCYDVDYYVNNLYEVHDRRHINLDSSSDSDCMIEEKVNKEEVPNYKKSKQLKNPFNILKRLSEKQNIENESSSSRSNKDESCVEDNINNYSNEIKDTSLNNWLPSENDFGRPELIENHTADPFYDMKKVLLLYDFAKFQPNSFNNWLGLKIAFLESLKQTIAEFNEKDSCNQSNIDADSLVKHKDCKNTTSILNKLAIIKTNKDTKNTLNLTIDYDVYKRDVENFKKTDLSAPHFRVVCLHESECMPTASDIERLCSNYNDDIPVVFALVSLNSVSYLQVQVLEIPVYNSDNTV